MNDLISRSALIESLVSTESEVVKNAPFDAEWFTRMQDRQNEIIDLIERAPAVDAVPAKRGHWITVGKTDSRSNILKCSCCGRTRRGSGKSAFCRDCGADMRATNERQV